MRNFDKLTLAIAAGSMLGWSTSAHALLIDDFNSPDSQMVALAPNPPSSDTDQAAAAVLGGERDLRIDRTGGNGSMSMDVNDTIAGALSFAEAFSTTGTGLVVWDGVDGSSAIDANGLGGLSLLADGATAFELGLIGSDQPSSLTVSVFSGTGNQSSKTVALPVSGAGVISFLFSDFVTVAGSGANFASVGAISLLIDGTPTAALDIAADYFQTNGTQTPVPEPSSLTLLGLGLAGIGRRLRRKTV